MLSNSHIKKLAEQVGFDLCGVAACHHFAKNEFWFREWLSKSYQSSLEYMERNLEKRFDPRLLVEGAQTAIVCAVSYKNFIGEGYPVPHNTKVASYACTTDYHLTMGDMLAKLLELIKQEYPSLEGRAFVDTAPILEKQLAVEAGLGWIGRQSLVVTPQFGSYVLLGEILLTECADSYDSPYSGTGCGSCRLCIQSCPTGAIVAPKIIDTARCIACHTIEKQPFTDLELDGWIFGCERCQSCCPFNQQAPNHTNAAFDMLFDPTTLTEKDWHSMTHEYFDTKLHSTPLTRSGLERIKGNIGK